MSKCAKCGAEMKRRLSSLPPFGYATLCDPCEVAEAEAMHDEEIRATAQEIMAAEDEEMHQEEAQEYEAELDARYHSLRAEEERGEDGSPEG